MSDAPGRSSLGLLLTTAALFAIGFLVLTSLLDVAFGEGLTSALKGNLDNTLVVTALWTIAMWFLRRRAA